MKVTKARKMIHSCTTLQELIKNLKLYENNKQKKLIIIDKKIVSLYKDFYHSLKAEIEHLDFFSIEANEEQKTLETVQEVYTYLIENDFSRDSKIIAIGGGLISDLAGYVAATFYRGIEWSIISTTLLGQVDAAIGGKTAVNFMQIKNAVGSFYFPKNIYLCHEFLKTLESKEIDSAKGEILKYAFLSKKVFDELLRTKDYRHVVSFCAEFKEAIVEKDFQEKSIRAYLNFGHTIGHAIESVYKYPHGICVALGIIEELRLLNSTVINEYNKLLIALNLDLSSYPYEKKDLFDVIKKDKKKSDFYEIKFIDIKNIGDCLIKNISFNKIEKFLLN